MPQSVQERWASSKEKVDPWFVQFEEIMYLCTRWWVIVRLLTQHRVFFDAVYSRMWNWVRSPIRNPVFPQFPRLPLYKEIQQFLTKLRKNERNAKEKPDFLFIYFTSLCEQWPLVPSAMILTLLTDYITKKYSAATFNLLIISGNMEEHFLTCAVSMEKSSNATNRRHLLTILTSFIPR